MAIDGTILAELDADIGIAVRTSQQGDAHGRERMRAAFDQNGHALNAAIGNILLLSSLPDQAMGSKLADRTPSPPAPPEPANIAK